MIWNYRVFREEEGGLSVREVFYQQDGKIVACSKDPVTLEADSIESLTQQIEWIKEALALPVLVPADVPNQTAEKHMPKDRSKNISHKQLLAQLGIHASEPEATGAEKSTASTRR